MKRVNLFGLIALVVLLFGLGSTLRSQGPNYGNTITQSMPVPTNFVAASSTNTTKATGRAIERMIHGARLTMAWTGVPASTNAGGTNLALTVYFETSPDNGVTWDNASLSNIKLSSTTMDAATVGLSATNVVSDWFNLTGVTKLRIGRIVNPFLGVVSNPVVFISYPYPEPVSNP